MALACALLFFPLLRQCYRRGFGGESAESKGMQREETMIVCDDDRKQKNPERVREKEKQKHPPASSSSSSPELTEKGHERVTVAKRE